MKQPPFQLERYFAARESMSIEANHIIVHAGAQDAIFSFVNTMLAASDHAIVSRAF